MLDDARTSVERCEGSRTTIHLLPGLGSRTPKAKCPTTLAWRKRLQDYVLLEAPMRLKRCHVNNHVFVVVGVPTPHSSNVYIYILVSAVFPSSIDIPRCAPMFCSPQGRRALRWVCFNSGESPKQQVPALSPSNHLVEGVAK